MINTYSKAKDGNKQLSQSFHVREFACKDGFDIIIIDDALVAFLQRIRNWAGAPIIITSGYRTKSHNAKIGGASNSYHVRGRAADIYVKDRKKTIKQIARYAQAIGVRGVELNEDSNYVHIDTRPKKYFWIRRGGRDIQVANFWSCPYAEPSATLRNGSSGNGVKWLQLWLNLWGYEIVVDGKFGKKTEDAVRDVQARRRLKIDGIVGEKTRAALKGY